MAVSCAHEFTYRFDGGYRCCDCEQPVPPPVRSWHGPDGIHFYAHPRCWDQIRNGLMLARQFVHETTAPEGATCAYGYCTETR